MKRTKKYKAAIICAALKNSDQFQDYLDGWCQHKELVTLTVMAECAEAWLEQNDQDLLDALGDEN